MSFLEFTYSATRFMRLGAIVLLVTLTLSLPVHAAVQWRRVGTVNGTLTNGQICYTNGQDILCDTNAPTLSGTNLGIGTASPNNALTVNGTVGYMLGTDLTTTGSQNDVAIGMTSAVRYNGAATATFTGIAAGANGQILYLHNPSNYTLTLSNQSLSSAAANRIVTGTGADLSVPANTSVSLQYDGTAALWRVTGSSNSANTLAAGTTGQVQFNGGTNLAADSNFTWDNTNKRLGIGSTTPAKTLDVVGTAKISTSLVTPLIYPATNSTTAIQFDKADGTTNVMNIDTTNGRVGIGTTSPNSALDVRGDTQVIGNFYDSSSSTAGSDIGLSNTSTGGLAWIIRSTGSASTGGAGNLRFDQPAGTPKMIITSAGNVGIGTTAPAIGSPVSTRTYVTVKGSGDAGVVEFASGSADADLASIGLIQFSDLNSTINAEKRVAIIKGISSGTTANKRGGALWFQTRNDNANALITQMEITNTGNVGIGIGSTVPASKLDVNGGISIGSSYAGVSGAPTNGVIIQGNVGIGTTAPATGMAADIAGPVKVAGSGSETCSASTYGAMRYNSAGGYFEICSP